MYVETKVVWCYSLVQTKAAGEIYGGGRANSDRKKVFCEILCGYLESIDLNNGVFTKSIPDINMEMLGEVCERIWVVDVGVVGVASERIIGVWII